MAVKTYAELQTQLADNTTGEISAADLRDFLDSVATEYVMVNDPTVSEDQIIAAADTWQDVDVTITGDSANRVTLNNDGSVTFDSSGGLFEIICDLVVDMSAMANNQWMFFRFDRDGSQTSTQVAQFNNNQTQYGFLRIIAERKVDAGDPHTIVPRISCTTTGTAVLEGFYLSVKSLPVEKT